MSTPIEQLPMIPVAEHVAAVYTLTNRHDVSWEYDLSVVEGAAPRSGALSVKGADVPLGQVPPGTRVRTPWGIMSRATPEDGGGWVVGREVGDAAALRSVPVPESALDREGTWTARTKDAMPWGYTETASALGSKSERRTAVLNYSRSVVEGHLGAAVDTPWGRMSWCDTPYEHGFLLRGTYDRPFDDKEGDVIDPTTMGRPSFRYSSLYLSDGVRLGGFDCHGVSLALDGSLADRDELIGQLILDPNQCSLSLFGDRAGCTKINIQSFSVSIARQRTADPTGAERRFFQVKVEGLDVDVGLVAHPQNAWCVLVVSGRVIPLFC